MEDLSHAAILQYIVASHVSSWIFYIADTTDYPLFSFIYFITILYEY